MVEELTQVLPASVAFIVVRTKRLAPFRVPPTLVVDRSTCRFILPPTFRD